MRDKLINLLGGRTESEYALLEREYSSQRNLGLILRDQVDRLTTIYNESSKERQRLQEIIFKNYGVIQSEENRELDSNKDDKLQPLGTAKQRWSSIRNRLESDDRARVLAEANNGDTE